MNVNGQYHSLMENHDMDTHMNNYFSIYFDRYLQTNYGINEETFRNAIKTLVPEEFI